MGFWKLVLIVVVANWIFLGSFFLMLAVFHGRARML